MLPVIPGPSAARSPESITTIGASSAQTVVIDSGLALRAPRNDENHRSEALNLSSAAAPGHRSLSPSALSGASTVLRWPCKSSASDAT